MLQKILDSIRKPQTLQERVNAGGTIKLSGETYLDGPLTIPSGSTVIGNFKRSKLFTGKGPMIILGLGAATGKTFTSTHPLVRTTTVIATNEGPMPEGWYHYVGSKRVRHANDIEASYMQIAEQGLVHIGADGFPTTPIQKATTTPVQLRRIDMATAPKFIGSVDCRMPDGSLGSQGIYGAGVLDLVLQDVTVTGFADQGIYLRLCTGGKLTRVHTETDSDAVMRYGAEFATCSNMRMDLSTTKGTRKLAMFSQGSVDCAVVNCDADGKIENAYDTHGTGSERIKFIGCKALEGSFLFGNPSWRAGDTDIEVIDCEAMSFVVGPNSTAKFIDCVGEKLILMCAMTDKVNDPARCPRTGPVLVETLDCTFEGKNGPSIVTQDWTTEHAPSRCFGTLRATRTLFGGTWAAGVLGDGDKPLVAMPGGQPTTIELHDCNISSAGFGIRVLGDRVTINITATSLITDIKGEAVFDVTGTVSGRTSDDRKALVKGGALVPVTR